MNRIKPILIDFDGVIKINDSPAPGADLFLKYITDNKIPSLILSNSTMYPGLLIQEFLRKYNIDFGIPCITAVDASLSFVSHNDIKIKPYCPDLVKELFSTFISDVNPDAVLIGDIGDKWNYETLNEIFRYVHNGAEIIAMQKNRFWEISGKISLDAGAFVAAIEYASGKKATVIGKPSPLYFQTALEFLGYPKDSSFIMIGDDIENDIEAAQKLGGTGILVFTGKTKYPLPADGKIQPDYKCISLSEVISCL